MTRFFRSLFAFPASRPVARRARPQVESLDGRVLPSATPGLGVLLVVHAHHGHRPIAVHHAGHKHTQGHRGKHHLTTTPAPGLQTSTAGPQSAPAPAVVAAAPGSPLAAAPADPVVALPVAAPAVPGLVALPSLPGAAAVPSAAAPLTLDPVTYTLTFEAETPKGVTGDPVNGVTAPTGPIQVLSFQLGATNETTVGSATSGAGGGRARFDELDVTIPVGDYSPILLKNLVTGVHYKTVTLTESRRVLSPTQGAQTQVVATWMLGTVFTVADQFQGDGSPTGALTEEVHFAYAAIQETVGNNTTTWNQVTNTDVFAINPVP